MEVKVVVRSGELTVEDIQALLQAIRDCEQKVFPNKKICISAEVPEMSLDQMTEVLAKIKPPFDYGPVLFKYPPKEEQQQ